MFKKNKKSNNIQSNNTNKSSLKQLSNESLKKVKMLITIVDRSKVEFYLDVLATFDVNLQFVTFGRGSASTEVREMLGLNEYKGIIFSIVTEDKVNIIQNALQTRFKTIRGGKGISCVIPLSSVMGVRLYQFIINNREGIN